MMMDQQKNILIKRNDKPTFKERIFGIPSSDEISKLKYTINFINILVVIGIMVLVTVYYTQDSFRNRAVIITTKYEDSIKLPEIKIEAQSIYSKFNPILIVGAIIMDDNSSDIYISKITDLINGTYNNSLDLTSGSVNLTKTSFTIYPSDYFSLGFDEDLRVILAFFRFKLIPEYYSFNVSITVNNGDSFLTSSKESCNICISKTIKIDKYKNQMESYKTRLSTVAFGVDQDETFIMETLEYQISFFTQIVTTETTQTDFDIYLEILSSVGSLISLVALGAGVAFSIITKFFIKDKGGWIDNNIREAIVYHSNLLNQENLQPLITVDDDENDNL